MATKKPQAKRSLSSFDDLDAAGIGAGYRPTSYAEPMDLGGQEPEPERGMLRGIADTGLEVVSGAAKGIKFMTDVVGANNAASRGLDAVSTFAKDLQSAQAKGEDQRMGEIMKAAEDQGVWEQVKAALSAAGEAPIRQSLGAIGTGLPIMAASMLPGLREAAWGTRMGAVAGMGAAQGAGIVKSSIYDAVYERAKQEGRTEEEARAMAEQQQSYSENPGLIAGGSALGGAASATGLTPALMRTFARSGAGAGADTVAPGLMRSLGMGLLKETPLEAGQGGQEQYAGNMGQNRAGFETPWQRGVAGASTLEAALSAPGGLAGGVMDYAGAKNAPMPVPSPGDAIRETELVPEGGPMTRAANVATEAKAQSADAALRLGFSPLAGTPVIFPDGSVALGSEAEQARREQLAMQANIEDEAAKRAPRTAGDTYNLLAEAKERGLDYTVALHPAGGGFLVVPRQWVTPQAQQEAAGQLMETIGRMRQADAAPVQRAPRTGTTAQELDLTTDPVTNYVDDLRQVNTPAAKLFVRDFDAGSLTADDVRQRMDAERTKTPDERLAAAAAEGLRMNSQGNPFKTLFSARVAAKQNPGEVIEVQGGYAIRQPQESASDPIETTAGPTDAGSSSEVPPTGAAAQGALNVQDAPQPAAGTQAEAAPGEAPAAGGSDAAAASGVPAAGGAAGVRSDGVRKQRGPDSVRLVIRRDIVGDKFELQGKSGDGEWEKQTTFDADADAKSALKSMGYDADSVETLVSDWNAKAKRFSPPNPAAPKATDVQADGVTADVPEVAFGDMTPDQRKRTRLEQEIATGKTNNGGVIANLRPSAIEKRKQELAQMGDAGRLSDLSKNPPKIDTSAEPAQETAKTEQVEPFEHAGLKIKTQRVKVGDEVKNRWVVQSPENAERERNGERQIGGDRIVDTREQAVKMAEQEAQRAKDERAQKDAFDREDAERKATTEARKEANRGKTVVERRKEAILDGQTKLPPSLGLGTGSKREAMQKAVEQERAIVEVQVDDSAAKKRDQAAIDAVRRAGYILGMSNENLPVVKAGLEAQARLKANNYKKPEYRVYMGGNTTSDSYREITKTEYDYAQELIAGRASAPQPETPSSQPSATEPAIAAGEQASAEAVNSKVGSFGPILTQYRGDAQGAIKALTELQDGEAVAALNHPEVGDIDLVWGKEGTSSSDGMGLAKLAKWHPEVLADLQGFLNGLRKDDAASGKNRIRLVGADGRAVVRLQWDGSAKTWLLTAFEDAPKDSTRTDTEVNDVGGDTASPNPERSGSLPSSTPAAQAANAEPEAEPDTPKLTQAEAAELMTWQDMGTTDGVKRHILTFYRSKADADAKTGRMTVATVTKGDRSATAWMVGGDDKTFGPLSLAKKRAMEAGMAKAVADGFVESGEVVQAPQGRATEPADATPAKIDDSGEKIGGARKDRWKERGLNLDDLDGMTEAEGAELATKANVWKPDYTALADAAEPVTAAMVKVIYDRLAAKPAKNTPEGRRQYVQMMRIVRDVYASAKGPEAVRNAYLEIRQRAGLNTMDPQAKASGRALLFSVYKGRTDPFTMDYTDLSKAKKMVEDGFPAKGEPWKARLVVGRREGGAGTTARGIAMYTELSAEVGTPLTAEQIEAGFFRVMDKKNKTVAFAASKEDAEAAAKTVYERDMKGNKDGKPEPERPHLDEMKRENLPKRIDRDATSDDFIKDLGFRGIEFGNWSAQDERQRILNMAYDGLMDLAEIMGVPPKAMSLNGTLGMAFGARGGGRFAAHYEPGKLVINMTKIRGGGSMAHEWAHAMDHYFGELNKADAYTTSARGASGWMVEDQYKGLPRSRMEQIDGKWKSVNKMRLDNLRPELAAAFDGVMQALFQKQINKAEMVRSQELGLERTEAMARMEPDAEMKAMYQRMAKNEREALEELRKDPEDKMYDSRGRSDFAKEAQALSGKSANGYWTRPTEMFARSFESWVFDRVTAMGARSDYLVHGVEADRFAGGGYKGNPYPTGAERARINAALDKLADTIQTKEDDAGNVAMFSRRSASGNRVPDVVIGHKLGDLNRHPDYAAAKAGDSLAAARIAIDLVDDAFVQRVRDAAGDADLIVPVVSVEAAGRNKIPAAVADLLAEKLGSEADAEIVQVNSPKRTAMDGLDRLLSPPVFEGPVRQGAAYVLVDDTVTQGGTFASLASHIRDNGGKVSGLVALTGKQYSSTLSPSPELLSQVRERFNDIEPLFQAATGYGFDALTESEARYLVKHDNAQHVRDRIAEAGNQTGDARDAGLPPQNSRSQGPTRGLTQRVATEVVNAISARWANAPEIVVVADMQDAAIPERVRDADAEQRSQGASGEPEGFFYKGKVYIVASALSKPADVVRVLFHETLGHFGLRGVFGESLTPILRQLAALRRADVMAKAEEYGLDMSKEADRLQAAEEVLAVLAQTRPELGYVQRAIAAIRAFLRKNVPGFASMKLTDAEIINSFILPARRFVEGGGGPRGGVPAPAFSRGDNGSTADQIRQFDVAGKTGNTLAHYRGMGLQALGRRQLVDLYQDYLPQLKKYDRLVQNMEAEKNDTGAEADGLARDWGGLDAETKRKGEELRLAELMHDATLAKIDPQKDYQAGDDRGQWAALRAKFNALDPKAQALYVKARDMYADHYAKVRKAIAERIERSEMSDGQKKKTMARMDDDFFKKTKGVYFPLSRFGSYVMVVKDANGDVVNVSRAETLNEAETTRKELMRVFPRDGGFNVSKVLKDAEFNAGRDAVGKGFMADLLNELDKQGVDDALRDSVSQLYLASLPDLSWAKHGIHRKGTPGFSQDARRAFAQNMFHGARHLAKLRYSDRLQGQLEAMDEHIKAYREIEEYDSVKAQQVLDEMVKRHESLMNPKTNPLSTALTSVGFVFYLGISPAAAMVNLSQTALVAYPIMGAKWGFGKASAALLRASKETVAAKNDISKVLQGDELAAYEKAVKDGTIDVTMAHDLAGISQGEDAKVTWALRPVMRAASFLFHHAERFNRQATFIASFRLAKETGADNARAFEEAKKATYDGHFDYGAANRPRVMQGNVAKVVLLFKQYGQNMVYTLSRQAYLSMKGLTPADRAEARKQLGGILALHAAAAGALGLPLVGPLLAAASFLGSDDDEPWNAEVALKNALADELGPKAAEVLSHGLSRLTPWDISSRVALDRLILPDVREGLEGQDYAEAMMVQAVGPVGSIFVGMAKGLQSMSDGKYGRGFEEMLPVALRNPIKAMRFAEEGAVDKSGVVIKDEVSLSGVLGQASGFAPSEVRLATEGKSAIISYDRALMDRRQTLMAQFAQARMAGDAEGMADARKDIERFNSKNPARRITPANLIQSVRARQRRIDGAEQGVYLPKNRRDAMEAGRFAAEAAL